MNNKENSNINIQNTSGQVNFSQGDSTLNANYTVNNGGPRAEEILRDALPKLIQELEKETKLEQTSRNELQYTARAMVEDIEEDRFSKKRMGKIHQQLQQAMPEMQFTATAAGICSAITDLMRT